MKVLVMANGHSLAHVSRPLEIAKVLRSRGHEVMFSGGGHYLNQVQRFGFTHFDTPYIDADKMQRALKSNKLGEIYPLKDLEISLDADLELIKNEKPDLILNDCRVTAKTAGEISKTPVVTIVNAHMTNHRNHPLIDSALLLKLGPSFLTQFYNKIQNAIEFKFYDLVMVSNLRVLREKWKLKPEYGYDNECSELNLVADIPEFNPIFENKNYQFIGPLTWTSDFPEPKSISKLDPKLPTVCLTVGSYSLDSILDDPDCLKCEDLQFVVVAGKNIDDIKCSRNVFIESFVNLDLLLPHCQMVACHGGSGTIYHALKHALPILGFSTHLEQSYVMDRTQDLGLGRHVPLKKLQKMGFSSIVNLSRDVLAKHNNLYLRKQWRDRVRAWDSSNLAADYIEDLVFGGRS